MVLYIGHWRGSIHRTLHLLSHVLHHTSHLLSHSTTHHHTCHHTSRIHSTSVSSSHVHRAHLAKAFGTRLEHLCLLVKRVSTHEVCLRLKTLGTLSFLALNTHRFSHILSINALCILHILDINIRLGIHSPCSVASGELSKFLIIWTFLVYFHRTNIKCLHVNAKIAFHSGFQIVRNPIINLQQLAFHLNCRYTHFLRNIGNNSFNIFGYSILDLLFELLMVKIYEPIEFDEALIIRDVKGHRPSDSHRNTMVWQSRVKHIKVWYSKAQLVVASQIDEVNLSLERRLSPKGQTHNTA